MDGASRDALPDGFDWDHLRSTGETVADPGGEFRRSFREAEERMPAIEPL
ncbi:MAG: hypothetical protein QOI38_389, partial [Sphingomonadales bacterium]|nr:hypothetical protein [Sphingomonadales bacterium]